MTDKPHPAKKRPDFIAYIPQPGRTTGQPPHLYEHGEWPEETAVSSAARREPA